MAQQVQLDQGQFCCSICLDLLKCPVTVPCGHNYCSRCIEGYWSQDGQRERFSCPQCSQMFSPRPVLKKNNMLADMMDLLKKTSFQAVPPDHSCYAGPGDVACDFCTGRKLKAVKTCLQCLVSYCDTHLQPHYQSPAFKKHKLITASTVLQENICSLHDEVTKLFCRTDQQCICYLCSVEEHKGHDMISTAVERTEKQKELDKSQRNFQQRIQEGEKDIKVFALIRDQLKNEVSRAEEQRNRVEQEVSGLRRRHAELEQLSHTEDHINFLQRYTSLSKISESAHPVSSNVRPQRYFEDVTVAVSKMRDKLEDIPEDKEEGTKVSETVNRVDVLLSAPEPKTRAEFIIYSCQITLDPNTAHTDLSLAKGNRKVTWMDKQQSYPHHLDRFNEVCQVLSREALTGRCYWEVELMGQRVDIAVSYIDIIRTGYVYECQFGLNDKSWSLMCYKRSYDLRHNDTGNFIPGPVSSRVGVYLDHSAGSLSFYSVSDTMTLLHRVQTTFTQPLYAGFWLPPIDGSTVELCDL